MKCKRKAYCVLIGLYCFMVISVFGQDQKIADSLARIYKSNKLPDTVRLELLRNLSFNELRDLNLSLQYAEELITLSSRLGNNVYLYRGYLQKGNKKRLMGDLDEALDIGILETLDDPAWTFIEWPEVLTSVLPENRLDIDIQILPDSTREIVILER